MTDKSDSNAKSLQDVKFSAGIFKTQSSLPIKEIYKITRKIGSGAYGEVRKCYLRETGELRAVKIIKKKALEKSERDRLRNESEILK